MQKYFEALSDMFAGIPEQKRKPLDKGVLLSVCTLSVFGIIMIWSASMYNAGLEGDSLYFVRKQAIFFAIGLVVMLIVSVLDFRSLKTLSNPIMVVALVLLLILFFLPEGESSNGAMRWITLLGVTMQPSELAKIAVMLFAAYHLARNYDRIDDPWAFPIVLLFCGAICFLIYKQPALSTAIIVGVIIIGMYFIAGGNFLYILALVGIAGTAVYFFITSNEWRLERYYAFLDPFSDIQGDGWQPAQSLMALGSGGVLGKGLGNGCAKLGFLPYLENDYIFAVIGEELGLVGCIALLCVYFLLIFRVAKIAIAAPDTFSRLYCSGMAILLGIQVFLNVAVVTNIMPSTGIILPFISSGGSSLITLMTGMGIVLNISRNKTENLRYTGGRR